MRESRNLIRLLVMAGLGMAFTVYAHAQQQTVQLGGVPCTPYPFLQCPDKDCPVERVISQGHTEGLEPHVTEGLIKLMVSAKGGKLQQAAP